MKVTPVKFYSRICPRCAAKVSISLDEIRKKKTVASVITCPICGGGIRFASDHGILDPTVSVEYGQEEDAV